jgi:endonuclease/exonuclease/phosphatase family metal-dependent hydrolase
MRTILILIIALIGYGSMQAQDLQVMTFNIRLNTSSDSLNAWPYRKEKVASQILFYKVNLLGVQEALPDQMQDLRERLPAYKSIGGGREDGKDKGEHSSIFYDTVRLQLLSSGMYWLSLTPDVAGSKGWDAALPRIVTWGRFRDRKTKKMFVAFNTHFDHMGKEARRQSAHMVLEKVKAIAGNAPVVFTGDFNAQPTDEPIMIILNKEDPLHLLDSKELSKAPHYGPIGTFNAFKNREIYDQPIDYIFVTKQWTVLTHATISETWEGRFASDHFAVLATLRL